MAVNFTVPGYLGQHDRLLTPEWNRIFGSCIFFCGGSSSEQPKEFLGFCLLPVVVVMMKMVGW